LIVLVSFISPFRSERRMARELMGEGEFVEVFVDTPLEVCMARDPKGLYEKAKAGTIKNFTGIDSPYEPPEQAEIVLKTVDSDAASEAERILGYLKERRLRGLSAVATASFNFFEDRLVRRRVRLRQASCPADDCHRRRNLEGIPRCFGFAYSV